jgi:acyl-CoA synthetase (AMP-forming)/AMP-acid ligase II
MGDRSFLAFDHDPAGRAFKDATSGKWFTRAELSRSLACFAEKLGFTQKALGFVFARNDAASLIAYLGSIEAGHAVAMLDPALDVALASRLVSRFQPDYIVAPASQGFDATVAAQYSLQVLGAEQVLLRSRRPHVHAVHPDLALLISTSGSTGSPRLVRLSWRNLESNAASINQALSTTDLDCAMLTSPIFNGYAQSIIHTHLAAGGSFVLTRDAVFSRAFWDTVRDAGCGTIGGTPYFYQLLDRLDVDALAVPGLKKFIQIGGRLGEKLARKYHAAVTRRGGELHIMYGQAEATARISGVPPAMLPDAVRSVGYALAGGRLWIENDGRVCGASEEGELVYEGPNVMLGYASEPSDLARGDELGGKLHTGDLGYRDDRGLFYITGRKARFVKLFGWRISLDDVEELLAHTGPVAAVSDNDRILIFCEQRAGAANGDAPNVEALAARLRMHPSGFEVRMVASIPRLANGKTDYRALVPDFAKS